jgi:putative nucleotidyltransferase with HDIG domain
MTSLPVLSPDLAAAVERAAGAVPVYAVGGFVRDALRGRASPDLDVATAADPERTARRLASALGGAAFPLGAEHGVYRVTLREPLDGIDQIDVAALRGTLEDDLALRDFTINAMAWQIGSEAVIDPHAGLVDLEAGVLRLVADRTVQDDPLRGLRAVRFAAELRFVVADASVAIIRRDAPLLARTSGERQRDELVRVLDTPVAAPMLRLADDLGLLDVLIPELIPSKACIQPKEHYYDVFEHQVEAVAVLDCILHDTAAEPVCADRSRVLWGSMPDGEGVRARYGAPAAEGTGRTYRALLKLAALLHDVSKPETRKRHANGRIRFFGHSELGAKKAAAILERLRFTTREIRLVELLIEDHLRPGQLSNGHELPSRRALYRFFRDLGEAVPDLLLLNLADHASARGPRMEPEHWAGHVAYIHWILEQRSSDETLSRPPRLLTGNDLMAELGLPPGPLLGRLLGALEEAQAVGTVTGREQALKLARRLVEKEQQAAAADSETDIPRSALRAPR